MVKLKNLLVAFAIATLAACGGSGSGVPSFPSANGGAAGGDGSSTGGTQTPPPAAEPADLRDLVGDPVATDVARFLTQATFGAKEEEL